MEVKIVRTCSFSDREVNEALIAWLKSKDRPAPGYVGDTPTTKWIKESHGITVEWKEELETEV